MASTNYLWDEVNDTLLEETDDAGNTLVEYTHEPGQFGPLISQRRNGHTYYHHYDGQGSTRALTDESSNVTDRYTYTAFGEPVASSGTTTNPFGYKGALGYYVNPETSDLYVRARTYSPAICRWLAKDPASSLVAEPYEYSRNNPALLVDPSGLRPLIIERDRGYTPNCHCGQAQMRWRIYPREEGANAYIVQKICFHVYAQQCDFPCGAPCRPIGRVQMGSKCIFELHGETGNYLTDTRDYYRVADAWRSPFLEATPPERNVAGEYSDCISVGFAVIWASIRGTKMETVARLPEWQRNPTIKVGDFELDVRNTPHLESEPAWWSNPTQWKWDYSGSNVMFTAWNCCPRQGKSSTHGYMCFASSSSFPRCTPCQGDFERRGP